MVHSHGFYTLYQDTFKKYAALYGQQVCVFLQKGSFYEFYGQEDPNTNTQLNTGKQCIDLLGLVCHTYLADGPNGTTGHYGGVPISHLDKWAGKLTGQGWTIVVIDEIKNGAGVISRRDVTRCLSASTHIDNADPRKAMFLGALWLEFTNNQKDNQGPPKFGVATADLTTGQVFLYEGIATGKSDVWHTDDLRHFFQVYPPKELLLFVRGSESLTQQEEETLRRTLYIPQAPIHMRQASPEQQGNLEKATTREDYLRSLFQPKTALPFRTWLHCAPDGSSLQERALTGLLRFSEDHVASLASCLQEPRLWHPTHSLQVINNALTQLNLIGTSEHLCVEALFSSPQTAMGKRSLTARLCSPIADHERILKRQEEVTWLIDASKQQQKEIEGCLSLTYDIARLHRGIIRGTVRATDIIQLNQSYQSVKLMWSATQCSPFQEPFTILDNTQACLKELHALFDVEKAIKAQESEDTLGFLKDSIAPKSAVAEQAVAAVYEKADEWLTELLRIASVSKDACYYKPTEKNMFALHSTKAAAKAIEKAAKHITSNAYAKLSIKALTSAARIEHPILDMFQMELDSAKATLKRMVSAELPAACITYATATRSFWQNIEEWVVNLDLSLALAKTAKKEGWVKPEIEAADTTSASRLDITNLRHPLIEAQKRQSKYVTHTVRIGYEDSAGIGWLLYGMNASGKSSLMKAIGLAVLLAQIGSYVPATQMTIRPFRRIATRILNQDNLWAGLSSFAVEMSELREILAVADHQTLVLGDELCAGTESVSGTAIVAAGIQHLHKAGARFVLATHLHDLMRLEAIKALPGLRVWHLHVEYDRVRDILVYHRTLRPGQGSTMYGLEVAKALHLPMDMIESAFALRRELLGEASVEDAPRSDWNTSIQRRACSACGLASVINSRLEVHHIQERSESRDGRNADGTALNHMRNLTTLCEGCHDKVHTQSLEVGPVEDTSMGPMRKIVLERVEPETAEPQPQQSQRKALFTTEQTACIRQILKANPGLSVKLWCFQIQKEHGIEIKESQLRTLQKKWNSA
jgi:DNA mismatch repair protein MutS